MHKNQPTFESLINDKQEFKIQTVFFIYERTWLLKLDYSLVLITWCETFLTAIENTISNFFWPHFEAEQGQNVLESGAMHT